MRTRLAATVGFPSVQHFACLRVRLASLHEMVRALTASALLAEPTTVLLYLTDLARTAKTATIRRRLSSISVAHQAAGLPSPTNDILVRSTWSGIRRTNGVAQVGKSALLTDDIRAVITTLPDTLLGRRDACLLLLGFAFRNASQRTRRSRCS